MSEQLNSSVRTFSERSEQLGNTPRHSWGQEEFEACGFVFIGNVENVDDPSLHEGSGDVYVMSGVEGPKIAVVNSDEPGDYYYRDFGNTPASTLDEAFNLYEELQQFHRGEYIYPPWSGLGLAMETGHVQEASVYQSVLTGITTPIVERIQRRVAGAELVRKVASAQGYDDVAAWINDVSDAESMQHELWWQRVSHPSATPTWMYEA